MAITSMATRPVLLAALAATAAGCASVPRDAGFDAVRAEVAERTGGQRVVWNQGTAADAAIESEVRSLLAAELTADAAVQVALLNNGNLQATYETLMVAQADLVAAGLLNNPVFDAEIRFAEGGGGTGLELALVQDFIDVFFIPLRKRLAGAAFEAAKLRVAGEAIDLAGTVRAAFYDLQAAQQTLELRQQIVAATGASYELAQRLRDAGNNTELDLFNERALYEQSKLNVRQAEAQVTRARESLNALMGLWGNQTSWTAAPRLPDLPSAEAPADDLERRAVARSLDLGAARQEVEVASRALGIAAPFGLLPEAEVGASAEREPDGEWAVGPAFSVPIPLFNQGQPAVAAAGAVLRASRQRYAAMAVALRAEVRAAHAALADARDRAAHYQSVLLPLRQQIVDQTQLQYNAMQLGAFQLLQAKQGQIDAAERYIGTLREYWLARTALDGLLAGRRPSFDAGGGGGMTPAMSAAGGGADH